MSTPIADSTQNVNPEINRPFANFPPSIWGDHFLVYASDPMKIRDSIFKQEHDELKEEVRRMVTGAVKNPLEKLELIDDVQRLGASYHFEKEIEDALEQIYNDDVDSIDDDDLHSTSLQFRLLRQQGYRVSCETFNKFKDEEGNFKESIKCDVKGMLSLYEATHLRIHEEDILDDALVFTITHLEKSITISPPFLAKHVIHALNRPLRRGLPRLEARHYLSIYEELEGSSHNKALLRFSKLDINILQARHQQELGHINKWWKDLDFTTKLPYARHRIVELYFWILGVYFEPQYALGRKLITKLIAIISIIDDTFDAYGSIEELELFAQAIQRWEISSLDQLPEYMKLIYATVLDIYNEAKEETAKNGMPDYAVNYCIEEMKKMVQGYFVEARWLKAGYVPNVEEYMSVALLTCGYQFLSTYAFLGLGKLATKEVFEWATKFPKIIKASSMINRLMDDIVSHKFEQERGHVASGIECYMKQHGVSEEEVVDLFQKQVTSAWKDINEEFLKPTVFPVPVLDRVINFARVIDVLYKGEDKYTNPNSSKDLVASLLKDPIPI